MVVRIGGDDYGGGCEWGEVGIIMRESNLRTPIGMPLRNGTPMGVLKELVVRGVLSGKELSLRKFKNIFGMFGEARECRKTALKSGKPLTTEHI